MFHAEMRLPKMCTWEGLLVLVVLHSLPKCSTCLEKQRLETLECMKKGKCYLPFMIIIVERGVWWSPPLIIFYFHFLP